MNPDYRLALPEDIDACVDLRGRTRENAFSVEQLQDLGITVDSWRAAVEHGKFRGHVCRIDMRLAGYCFADVTAGEIVVLALLPEWDGRVDPKAPVDADSGVAFCWLLILATQNK